jgi:hypothetical protein
VSEDKVKNRFTRLNTVFNDDLFQKGDSDDRLGKTLIGSRNTLSSASRRSTPREAVRK